MELGWTQLIFTSLKYLHQLSQDHTSQLPPPPPLTPPTTKLSKGPVQALSAMSILATVGNKKQYQFLPSPHIMDKLPTFITPAINMQTYQLDYARPELVAIATMDSALARELRFGLVKTISKLIDGFTVGWKKVSISNLF